MKVYLQSIVDESVFDVTEIITGGARGIDQIGYVYARSNDIPVTVYDAKWDVLGRSAGPIRNRKMAKSADALIAIWKDKSPGTQNMIKTARELGFLVFVKCIS